MKNLRSMQLTAGKCCASSNQWKRAAAKLPIIGDGGPRTFIAALVSVAAIFPGCKSRDDGESRYEAALVTRGNIVQHVTASGSLGAVVSVDVGSQVSGKISLLNVDFNSQVKRGQLIAEIDPTVYEAALRQAEGELASAQADVALKRQNLERKNVLAPLRAASQMDVDQAVAELAQAESAVIVRQANVDSTRANLGYCKITSPVDGVVIARKIDLGQTVNAAMNTPVLFAIAQDSAHMNISASVSEADIGQVREGQTVSFTVDAFSDETFHGKVSQVRRSPTTSQNVVTYETIITVDNPEQKLFPGMTADVSILVAERQNALKIPNSALRYTPPEDAMFEQAPPAKLERNQRLIYLPGRDSAKLRSVIIRTGITDGVDTEILAGLDEREQVVTSTIAGVAKSNSFGGPPPAGP